MRARPAGQHTGRAVGAGTGRAFALLLVVTGAAALLVCRPARPCPLVLADLRRGRLRTFFARRTRLTVLHLGFFGLFILTRWWDFWTS
ncbi:hypothetical protein IPT68_13150 [Streptomyces chromofuscus]|uniref:Uncharacterized protein n=1 Tax=Streptomyces chromofuscus TaxID=42881 RepID=A0A7M2TE17_STRCW|nr:hypothetical protein [Streptomyces chromofuscus]QOV46742.1 hypothetical protein IPT68_13150 [Streptomyces chromofuscus]